MSEENKNIFDQFADFVENVPQDKKVHFLAGLAITILISFFLSYGVAFLIAIGISALKELYDKISGTGVADIYDFLYSSVGAFVGFLLMLAIRYIVYAIF